MPSGAENGKSLEKQIEWCQATAFFLSNPPKKHASGSPSHLCCTSSSHKCGGYKWSVEQPVDFPPWCQVRVESVTCKVSLVLTSDPRLPCVPGEENSVDPSHGEMNMKLAG
ncbi:hypothetical protein PGIGA_G00200740 [Pangasianodon gigas]|uniref:Uncharacterized protein n=1 Tax=Pangasianodon gigas TaxID=30993 RepID=A0ACC5WDP6_PANGG|nr:hypothetical protein [Pangasianodon gigas]